MFTNSNYYFSCVYQWQAHSCMWLHKYVHNVGLKTTLGCSSHSGKFKSPILPFKYIYQLQLILQKTTELKYSTSFLPAAAAAKKTKNKNTAYRVIWYHDWCLAAFIWYLDASCQLATPPTLVHLCRGGHCDLISGLVPSYWHLMHAVNNLLHVSCWRETD